jgi:hypothetical protein
MMKLTLELSDNQVRALLTSLELFERCAMGDFDQIAEAISGYKYRNKFVESGIEKLLQWFFYEGRKFGIAQCPVPDAKIAYEIMYEIRHAMCKDTSSCYHWPIHKVTQEPLAKVGIIK